MDNCLEGICFAIGEQCPIKIFGDSCRFGIDETGMALICGFNSPTPKEIQAFDMTQPFTMKYIRIDGVLFLLFKFAFLPWMDCPYDIRLSPGGELLPEPDPGEGYALRIVFVDTKTNIIKSLRLIGLGEKFSKDLRAEIFSVTDEPLIKPVYDAARQNIYRKYSSDQLAKMAAHYYRLNV